MEDLQYMEISLQKPFQKDGQNINKLSLTIEKLTGNDIMKVEKELSLRGNNSANPLFSTEGLAIIAAKASGQITEDIFNLSAPDFLMVTNSVSNFLFGWALQTGIQSNI